MQEPILEPFLRKMRIKKVLPIIKKIPSPVLLDIGCGWEAKFLKSIEAYISKGIGIDFKAPRLETSKIKTINTYINDRLPFDDSIFNVVTMLAVLEHIANPIFLVKEINRILCGGGVCNFNCSK